MAADKGEGDYTLKISGPGHTFQRKVAEDAANKIISFVMSGSAAALEGSGKGNEQKNEQGQQPLSKDLTPKQFMAQKKPGNNCERVACLAYYLTNYRDTPHFKTPDIDKLNTESAHHFTSARQLVADATNAYHYLSAAGAGKKQITTLGEAVVEALPDRAKVKTAIAEHKPARKRGVKRRVKAK
jgi:hypothetical protein